MNRRERSKPYSTVSPIGSVLVASSAFALVARGWAAFFRLGAEDTACGMVWAGCWLAATGLDPSEATMPQLLRHSNRERLVRKRSESGGLDLGFERLDIPRTSGKRVRVLRLELQGNSKVGDRPFVVPLSRVRHAAQIAISGSVASVQLHRVSQVAQGRLGLAGFPVNQGPMSINSGRARVQPRGFGEVDKGAGNIRLLGASNPR